MNPKRERAQLLLLTLFSFILLLGMGLLLDGCKRKPTPPTSTPVRPRIDSTRIRLQQRADQSGQASQSAARLADSTQTDYFKKLESYDTISVELP